MLHTERMSQATLADGFHALHRAGYPLLLVNVWNATAAKGAFAAVATATWFRCLSDPSRVLLRDTSLAVVTRGPLAKSDQFRERMGWTVPWYSSFGSDFNYDSHVTLDAAVAPVEYNYEDLAVLGTEWERWSGEQPGMSAFLRRDYRVFHTYSGYARGGDLLIGTYNWLDLTARGRQEDWEKPAGRSDSPSMGWLRHHDKYDT